MKLFSSCKEAVADCLANKYVSIAHLYREEKSLDMHIHDCYELYYSISGGKQFLIDGTCYQIQPGDIFVINPFESHRLLQVDSEVHERIVLSIDPEFLSQLSSEKTDLTYCFSTRTAEYGNKITLNKEEQKRFRYYIDKMVNSEGFGQDLMEQARFLELMVFLNKRYFDTHATKKAENKASGYQVQVNDILAYINLHIAEVISIEKLAEHFYLSESYICRVFKAETGTTINKYMTGRRISIAKSLLVDGLNVNEVCDKCGYNDYSNFIRTFTKVVGVSPKKYALLSKN